MIYCYFSYAKDARILAASVRRLLEVEPEAVVYVANDERDRAAVPEGCREVLTRYERGGTGTGLAAVEGELLTMQHILRLEQADYITKIDSDVWPNDTAALQVFGNGEPEPDFLGYEVSSMLQPSGAVYRLSKWAVEHALSEVRRRWREGAWVPTAAYSENYIIFRLTCLSPTLRAKLLEYKCGKLVGMHDEAVHKREHMAEFVHCGEPLADGTRVAREHVYTRMLLLKTETKLQK